MTTNACASTLIVLMIGSPLLNEAPTCVQLQRAVEGDAIAALKTVVRVLEVQGVLCETPDAAIEAATAAGFVVATMPLPATEQLAFVMLRYPMIGRPTASVRLTTAHGTTALPLDRFRVVEPVR